MRCAIKIQDYEFSKNTRQDKALVDFLNDITKIINYSRYENALAKVSLTGQTNDISTATIYTPASAGLFRVSVYLLCTTAGGGTLSCIIGWNDGQQAQTSSPATGIDLAGAGNASSGTLFVRSGATAITYATAIAAKTGSPQYSIFITIEEMVGG